MTGEPADPYDLPRQRHGTTPQMHGRYPDYDVLDNAPHWDAATRRVVLARIHDVPPVRFFDPAQAATVSAFADVLTAQDAEPRIPLVNFIDEKLHEGTGEGYQYFDMPDDREAWRLVVAGLDAEARARSAGAAASFADAGDDLQHEIVGAFAQARLDGGVWGRLNVDHAFSVVMHDVLVAFYSHPWAWNEIGWGGPAYPRGYARFGTPHLQPAEREPWEGREAFDRDPVSGEREAPPS
ncbi:MAG: gluconate 2-dehydrogenase subunit 3 family protein [Solirubrobacterales bacterium]